MRIDAERLAQRLGALSRIGATPQGGVTRLALSAEDCAARAMVLEWCTARGMVWRRDEIGNLFVRRAGTSRALPLLTGSHLDTQRNGGNYDGIYGVLAGLEVLESLTDADVATRHPFELVVWNNEEGVRYAPVTMGSSVYGGQLALQDVLGYADAGGVTVADALAADAAVLPTPNGTGEPGFSAYVELHIEQGPVLEAREATIGVVTGVQGTRQFVAKVPGRAAHAGTTPASERDDAFLKALALHAQLQALSEPDDTDVRFTVGRFAASPGTPNTVPGAVEFTIDLRHPDADVLTARGDAMLRVVEEDARFAGCTLNQTIHSPPVAFDGAICKIIADAARKRDYCAMRLLSGATHDARNVAHLAPTGMIFVPSKDGVSHNPAEWTDPDQIAAGCQILADTLLALDRSNGTENA